MAEAEAPEGIEIPTELWATQIVSFPELDDLDDPFRWPSAVRDEEVTWHKRAEWAKLVAVKAVGDATKGNGNYEYILVWFYQRPPGGEWSEPKLVKQYL